MKACVSLSSSPRFLSLALALALPSTLTACSGSDAGGDLNGSSSGSGTQPGGSGSSATGSGPRDGTSGNSNAANEALFAAPTNPDATPGSIYGVWGGSIKDLSFTFDSRFKFEPNAVTFATRCLHDSGAESALVGVTAAARVDEAAIAILESKKDEKKTGEVTCRANLSPSTLKRCDDSEAFRRECFVLEGTELTMYGASSLDKAVLTKLSD